MSFAMSTVERIVRVEGGLFVGIVMFGLAFVASIALPILLESNRIFLGWGMAGGRVEREWEQEHDWGIEEEERRRREAEFRGSYFRVPKSRSAGG